MNGKVARSDATVAELAKGQHGVASSNQLYRLGLSDDAVRARVLAGRLHRIHRGVYAVGRAALSPEGRWLAAVLALGGGSAEKGGSILDHWGAAVSHRSAACLWNLLSARDGPTDVVVRGDSGRAKRSGIRVHRSLALVPEVNIRIGQYLIDFLWRDRRLIVETDGYLYHRGRAAFQEDRDRDLDLERLGYDVLRLSERQVDEEPNRVAEMLAAALSRRANS